MNQKYPWLVKDIKKYLPKLKSGFVNASQVARIISENRKTKIGRQLVSLHLRNLSTKKALQRVK